MVQSYFKCVRTINIQQDINNRTFKALHNYFHIYFGIKLKKEDLATMDLSILAAIDFKRLALIKDFGFFSLLRFKILLLCHSILIGDEFFGFKKNKQTKKTIINP